MDTPFERKTVPLFTAALALVRNENCFPGLETMNRRTLLRTVRKFMNQRGYSMLKEFRDFALRGNIVELAIGIVMGVAFGNIVDSFVKDIIMPPIGWVLGGVDFSDLFIDLSGVGYTTLAEAQEAGAPTLNYGLFINTIISFIIIALAMFFVVKAMNTMQREKEAETVEEKPDPQQQLIEAINRLADSIQK